MAESEVEIILREIRERVIAEQRSAPGTAGTAPTAGESDAQQMMTRTGHETVAESNLALIDSHLTTTARTWDRLPPLLSNRSGALATLELWLKRKLKSATRWFTWEQVNFNAAVHHALGELPPIFAAYQNEIARLRAQLEATAEAQQIQLEQYQTDLEAQRNEIDLQRRATTTELRNQIEEQRIQAAARLAELISELRERVTQVQEEQRVSFKQISLETSEAAVLEDRARRNTESLLGELQRRIDQLEK